MANLVCKSVAPTIPTLSRCFNRMMKIVRYRTSSIVYLPSNFSTLYLSADGRTCDTCSFSLEQVTSPNPNCKLLCVLLHRHACCLFTPFLNKLVSNLRSNSSLHLPIALRIQPLVAVQWASVRRPKRHSTYSGAYYTSTITFQAAHIFHITRAPITIESVDITSSIYYYIASQYTILTWEYE